MERDFRYINDIHGDAGAREIFEKICTELFYAQYGEKAHNIRANSGDHGIDILVGDFSEPIENYQCKFFLNGIGEAQKKQIRDSFKTSVNSQLYQLKKWVLCVPCTLNPDEFAWWSGWMQRQQGKYGISIDLYEGPYLISQLKKYDIYNTAFNDDIRIKLDQILASVDPTYARKREYVYEPQWMKEMMRDNFLEVGIIADDSFVQMYEEIETTLSKKCKDDTRFLLMELLLNATQHGKAERITLHIERNCLVFKDNGREFNPISLLSSCDFSGGTITIKEYTTCYPEVRISYNYSYDWNMITLTFETDVFSVNRLCEIILHTKELPREMKCALRFPESKAKYYYVDFSKYEHAISLFCRSVAIGMTRGLIELIMYSGYLDAEVIIHIPKTEDGRWDEVDRKMRDCIEQMLWYGLIKNIHIVR